METIPKIFTRTYISHEIFTHYLIKRKNQFCIYKATYKDANIKEEKGLGYEVHKIREQKANSGYIKGKLIQFKHKEILATDKEFGIYAGFYPILEIAEKKFNGLLDGTHTNFLHPDSDVIQGLL